MSLIKRRVIAIVSALLAIIILAVTCSIVLKYTRTLEYEDADGKIYHILNNDGEYKLYEKGGDTPLPTDEQYGFFVTTAGTLVKIDPKTGAVKEQILVDSINQFIGSEQIGNGARVLIFPHVERNGILSIEVKNAEGQFTFVRLNDKLEIDPKGSFAIKESPLTEFNGEKFSELVVGTGYAISTMKIKDPIKDANGEYTEYGLVPEERERVKIDEKTGEEIIDEETGEPVKEKYNYEPAYYIVTETSGKKHKMIVGDEIVVGGGYYVQYVEMTEGGEVKRDAVYILGSTTGNSVQSKIENYISPVITYPFSMANYYDVENFVIGQRNTDTWIPDLSDAYGTSISFSYIDIEERQNSVSAVVPYAFSFGLEGYNASDTAINSCLYKLYSPEIVGTAKAFPSSKDLIDYGFFTAKLDENGEAVLDDKGEPRLDVFSKYTVAYEYDVLNETHNAVDMVIKQRILISDRDFKETGNYYVYSVYEIIEDQGKKLDEPVMFTYDYITEVSGETLTFLAWDEYDWVNPSYIDQNIAFITDIKISSSKYSADFKLDNSQSDQTGGLSSANLFVTGSASDGKKSVSFGVMEVVDERGNRWTVTSGAISAKNAAGQKLVDKENTFYDYNNIGNQVYCLKQSAPLGSTTRIKQIFVNGEEIKNAEGATVDIMANNVVIHMPTGDNISYLRYETELFRRFFQTLLYATLIDSYKLTPEKEQELINDPKAHILTIEITQKDADKSVKNEETGKIEVVPGEVTTNVYKFYTVSARKSYITVNGRGGFYVYTSRLQKILNDAVRYFNGENIDPGGSK